MKQIRTKGYRQIGEIAIPFDGLKHLNRILAVHGMPAGLRTKFTDRLRRFLSANEWSRLRIHNDFGRFVCDRTPQGFGCYWYPSNGEIEVSALCYQDVQITYVSVSVADPTVGGDEEEEPPIGVEINTDTK